jgi:NAD(P)-dependent dehydrogenase (short-subunit alcohol dehydrogenase family)
MAEHGIRVNAVSGGIIESESMRKFPGHEKLLSSVQDRIPARRLGLPEDIANAVIFLASDESSWIYGHILVVDGGLSL